MIITTDDNRRKLHVEPTTRGITDFQVTFRTKNICFKNLGGRLEEDWKEFHSKEDETKLLLKDTIKVIPDSDPNPEGKVKRFKWVLAIERPLNANPPIRYRTSLFSTFDRMKLRHTVHGSFPPVEMPMIRILIPILLTLLRIVKKGNRLVFFTP